MSECPSFQEHSKKPDVCVYYVSGDNKAGFCKRPSEFRCIEDLTTKNPDLSQSSVGDWLVCKQMYWLKHIFGIEVMEPKQSGAVKMGSLWDTALSVIFGQGTMESFKEKVALYQPSEFELAKVKAMARAYRNLEITVEPDFELQHKFRLEIPMDDIYPDEEPFIISGVYDRLYDIHFAENKFTASPDFYDDKYYNSAQIGTYFLAKPELEYCTMELAITPQLKLTGQYKEESAEAHLERCYQDIISRPSHYFIGYKPDTRTYGVKYYRSEYQFRMWELEKRYKHIAYEIRDCYRRGQDTKTLAFYRNDKSCNFQFGRPCDYLPICRGEGAISEEIFRIRGKEGVDGNLIQMLEEGQKKAKEAKINVVKEVGEKIMEDGDI